MELDRDELITALEKVRPGLANKEMIEQSTSFAFMDGRVVTYNDELSISHPVPDLDIEGAIQAEPLYALLKKVDKKKIKVRTSGSEVVLSAGRARANLTLHEEVKLPLEEVGEAEEWQELADPLSFMDALRFAHLSCSRDMSRPILTCVHLTPDGFVESSDNYRVTRLTVEDAPEQRCLIPATSIRELLAYDVTHMATGEGWVHFSTSDDTLFSCRVYTGAFPDVGPLLEFDGNELDLSGLNQKAIERSMIFAEREYQLDEEIRVTIGDSKMVVSSDASFGRYKESLKFGYDEPNASFAVNPALLQDILKRSTDAQIGDGKLKFEGENWEHVIALRMES